MNQIALEASISKGKVHYSITDWKNKIAIPVIDGIRNFTVLVKKSNTSIQQCAQSFRMILILKNLGIQEGDIRLLILMMTTIMISEAVDTMNYPHL